MTRTHQPTEFSILAILALLALAAACSGRTDPSPVTGLVDATEIDVASKIPGRIKDLTVREGDRVEVGQALVTIESQEVAAKIDQVRAAVSGAKAKLAMARHGARDEEKDQARKALDTARSQLTLAAKGHARATALLKTETVTQAAFDDADFKYKAAQDQVAMAQARYDMVMKGARSEELDGLEALVKQGEGSLSEVESYGRETSQTAPISGEVAKILVHRGELAATGYPILTLVDRSDSWAAFPVREDLLSDVKVGTILQVQVPALRKTVAMKVYSIAPMGDFATWRATGDKASFDLRTFEVRARPVQPEPDLRPGMTARFTPALTLAAR
jgi:HlyD family secretion protein